MNEILNLKKPISVFWEPTEYCNLQCKHCYTNSGPNKSLEIKFSKAQKIVDQLYEEGIYSIGLGGGEPLTLPFLCDLIKYINSKGMQISISTNGLLLSDIYLRKLKEAGLKILQVSIDGLKETHENIRGKGTFSGLFNKIELAQEYGIGVRVGYTVNSMNYKEIDEFIQYAKMRHVHVINFFRYMPYHIGSDNLALSAEELLEVATCLLKHRKNNSYGETMDKFYITFEPMSFFSFLINQDDLRETVCTAGRSKFVIDCSGNVRMCNYLMNQMGNIDDGLEHIWKEIGKECNAIHVIPQECKECPYAKKCMGGCRGFSYANYGKFGEKDNACFRHLL